MLLEDLKEARGRSPAKKGGRSSLIVEKGMFCFALLCFVFMKFLYQYLALKSYHLFLVTSKVIQVSCNIINKNNLREKKPPAIPLILFMYNVFPFVFLVFCAL
jgi:hypothetical protein